MKNYLFIFFSIVFIVNISAQDTIIKSDGIRASVKVLEVTTSDVKYKKFNFLDGPTYIEKKTEIQLIKYSNGSIEEFNTVPKTAIALKTTDKTDTVSKPIIIDDDVKAPFQIDTLSKVTVKDETVKKAPVKNETDDYYSASSAVKVSKTGQLSISKKKFKLNDAFISETECYNLLKQTNNKEIMALVDKAQRSKKRQYISFGCILGGTSFIVVPAIFILVEPIPILLYFKYSATRKTCNKKAVELYNKK